jgi:hypothetical protein
MARENFARALLGLGEGAGQWAEARMKQEALRIENQRALSLENLRHTHQLDEAGVEAGYRATLAEQSDRRARDLAADSDKRARDLAHDQNAAADARQNREDTRLESRQNADDRKRVEEDGNTQLAALQKDIQTVRTDLAQGKYIDPSDAESRISEAQDQMRKIRARVYKTLSGLGDPRYKGMPNSQILALSGFSKQEVAGLMRSNAEASLVDSPAPDSSASPDLTSPAPNQGLVPTSNAVAPPESPTPLDDMSKIGRGRGLPTRQVPTRGGTHEMIDWGSLFKNNSSNPNVRTPMGQPEGRGRAPSLFTGDGF